MGSMPVHSDVDIDKPGHLSDTYVELLPSMSVSIALGPSRSSSLYLSVARGYKSGGFNTQMFSDILQQEMMAQLGAPNASPYESAEVAAYRPEKSWNYEAGAHLATADGRLAIDAALFFIRCTDQQLTVFPDESLTGRRMANAGRTRSFGAELAAQWRSPLPGLALSIAYGFTNARFRRYTSGGVSYRGKQIPYAPRNTLHASASYRIATDGHGPLRAVVVNLGCQGAGKIAWDDDNTSYQPFYALLNASVAIEANNASLTLWGENLTATAYDAFRFTSIGNTFAQRGKPRHLGATFRINF